MNLRVIVRIAVVVVLLTASLAHAQITNLIKSPRASNTGDLMASFERPSTDTKRRVVYDGLQYAVMSQLPGAGVTVRVVTGDPLPAPLAGTFNTFMHPVVGDGGHVVFFARLNSTVQNTGYFLHTAGGGLISVDGGLAVNIDDPADVNANGDVVWTNAKGRELYHYDFASGTNTLLVEYGTASVPGGGTWARIGRTAITNDGKIAFVAETNGPNGHGVYVYDTGTAAITEIAREGSASPAAGLTYDRFNLRQPVAVDRGTHVAFTAELTGGAGSPTGVFLFEIAGGTTTTIALEGDPVLDGPAGAVVDTLSDQFVAIDELGRVAMLADIDPGVISDDRILLHSTIAGVPGVRPHSSTLQHSDEFAPRLTDSTALLPAAAVLVEGLATARGVKVFTAGPSTQTIMDMFMWSPLGLDIEFFNPSINRTGEVAFTGRHRELCVDMFGGPNAYSVHEAGDPSPAGGGLVTWSLAHQHALSGRYAAFMVGDSGPPPPGLSAYSHAIGMFKVTAPNVVVRVAASNDPAPAGIGGQMSLGKPSKLLVTGRRVLFATDVFGGAFAEAIVAVQPGQPPRAVLTTGIPTPVGPFTSIREDRMALAGKLLVFEGVSGPANDISLSIMKWKQPASLQTLVKVGDALPTGLGNVASIGEFVVNKRGGLAYAVVSDLGTTAIFYRDPNGIVSTVALDETPVPASVDPTALFDFDDTASLGLNVNGDVFFATSFTDATTDVEEGLFHYDGVGLNVLALSGVTATPGGGVFGGVAGLGNYAVNSNEVIGVFLNRFSDVHEAVMAVPY